MAADEYSNLWLYIRKCYMMFVNMSAFISKINKYHGVNKNNQQNKVVYFGMEFSLIVFVPEKNFKIYKD